MAGVLAFSLQMDTSQLAQSANVAAVASGKLNSFLAATPESLHRIKDASKLTSAATHALSSAMSSIGFAVAPQLTGQLMGVSYALKSFQKVASITGIGIAGIGLAALGGATSFFTWSKGIEAVNAGLKETASAEALQLQMREKTIPAMVKEVDVLISRGRLDKGEGAGLKNLLNSGNPEFQLKAIKQVTQKGLASNEKDIQAQNTNKFRAFIDPLGDDAISDPVQRLKAAINREMNTLRDAILDKAGELKAGGPLLDEALKNIETTRKRKLDEADLKIPSQIEALNQIETPGALPDVTALEKIGFVFNGGGRGSNDHARSTSEHTRSMLNEQIKTNALLARFRAGADFTNK